MSTKEQLSVYAGWIEHLRRLVWTFTPLVRPMTTLHPRHIRPLLLEALADTRVVFVAGARQVGKTTLTREIATREHPMTVFNLDETATRDAALRDPAGFLATLSGPALIDEIQHAPDLLLEIKSAVDKDNRPGRFLLTGSANILAVMSEISPTLPPKQGSRWRRISVIDRRCLLGKQEGVLEQSPPGSRIGGTVADTGLSARPQPAERIDRPIISRKRRSGGLRSSEARWFAIGPPPCLSHRSLLRI